MQTQVFCSINWICSLGVLGQGDRGKIILVEYTCRLPYAVYVKYTDMEDKDIYAPDLCVPHCKDSHKLNTNNFPSTYISLPYFPLASQCRQLTSQSILLHSKEYLQFINEAAGDVGCGDGELLGRRSRLKEN